MKKTYFSLFVITGITGNDFYIISPISVMIDDGNLRIFKDTMPKRR